MFKCNLSLSPRGFPREITGKYNKQTFFDFITKVISIFKWRFIFSFYSFFINFLLLKIEEKKETRCS